jgi:hypothetical protein
MQWIPLLSLSLHRPAQPPLLHILAARVGHGLPLHVGSVIVRATSAKRVDVVDHVARTAATASAGRRTRIFTLEGKPLGA